MPTPSVDTQGILNPVQGFRQFALNRIAPASDLAAFVERHWVVRWEQRGEEPFEQEVLPHPCVNLAFEPGRSAVHGIGHERSVARLVGTGRVVATKFVPGGFQPFSDRPLRALVDCVLPVEQIFGPGASALEAKVLAEPDDERAVALIEDFLRSRQPQAEADLLRTTELVRWVREQPEIARAEELASRAGLSLRSLQRLFDRYLGVGPKWVIRRTRAQNAAERVALGEKVDWAELARELGYYDQAHLIRDFKAQVGFTPAAYQARCAAASVQPAHG